MKLLIAEDEQDIAEVVAFGARMNWPDCRVLVAADGQEALRTFNEEHPDIVVLDINMPAPNGFEVCRQIREVSEVPILMLTARISTLDKIRALDQGADDYLTKPFDHLELLARLRALVRRSHVDTEGKLVPSSNGHSSVERVPDFTVGDLQVHFQTRQVFVRGAPVTLTSTEFRLLEELVKSAGKVLSHTALLSRVWGPEYAHEDHYLKVFVRRLRRKLGDTSDKPRYIFTEWGIGYRFIAPD